MGNKKYSSKKKYDFEMDDYDRLKEKHRKANQYKSFTNKVNFKRFEFDYEEDPYEPDFDSHEL